LSALASLVRAYDRLPERGEAPAFGYSVGKVGFLIPLNEDGSLAGPPIDLREGEGKRRTPRALLVPQPTKRTSGIAPNFLWDKTSYALRVTAGGGRRTIDEHAAFLARHRQDLVGTNDPGLQAFLQFLDG
jgi:CRISPR-associated protein Csd1